MRRRDFLLQSASFSVVSLLPPPGLADASSNKIVDCHCHLFNASDLPINGFVNHVVLPGVKNIQDYQTKYGNVIRFLIDFSKSWALKYAPKAAEENAVIEKIINNETAPRSVHDADHVALSDFIDQLKSLRINTKNFSLDESIVSAYLPGVLVGYVVREAFPLKYPGKGYLDNSDGAFDARSWDPTPLIVEQIYRQERGPISHYLNWVLAFTHYRYENALELENIHGGRALLATPALIDFSHWLNDNQNVALDEQVDAMSWVSRLQAKREGGMHIHGFAPFDPLREALNRYSKRADPQLPLELAQQAVRTKGFIGVKLYPPMGFLPLGNTKSLSAQDFPDHLDIAFRRKLAGYLDAVLNDLYKWCEAEQVPILAHARDSNGPDANSSGRANPDNWSPVLEAYPGLRISLAHFGDFKEGFATGNGRPKITDTWEYKMLRLVQQHPNCHIYIDISYFDSGLLPNDNDVYKEVCRMFSSIIAEQRGPVKISERMLFGTDWDLFGQENLFPRVGSGGRYATRIFEVLSTGFKLGPDASTQILLGNAITFLGLNAAAPSQNHARLKQYYDTNGISSAWLDAL
jgi:Amidohydrolase